MSEPPRAATRRELPSAGEDVTGAGDDLAMDPQRVLPERRCSSRTFRYGYLVTT